MSHNPYVGIQHTVFEQGWKRGRKALRKDIHDEVMGTIVGYAAASEGHELEIILTILAESEKSDA